MAKIKRYTKNLFASAREFIARKERTSHPEGEKDNGGRWYPYPHERCACCAYIRSPSRSYPWSYMTHCRTAEHVAHLYGVDASELKSLALSVSQHEIGEIDRVRKRLGKGEYARFLAAHNRNSVYRNESIRAAA